MSYTITNMRTERYLGKVDKKFVSLGFQESTTAEELADYLFDDQNDKIIRIQDATGQIVSQDVYETKVSNSEITVGFGNYADKPASPTTPSVYFAQDQESVIFNVGGSNVWYDSVGSIV